MGELDFREFLGWEAEDKITGYKGVITAYASYLTGCDQISLTPRKQSGEPKTHWFDINRVTLKGNKAVINIETSTPETKGCDIPAPSKG